MFEQNSVIDVNLRDRVAEVRIRTTKQPSNAGPALPNAPI